MERVLEVNVEYIPGVKEQFTTTHYIAVCQQNTAITGLGRDEGDACRNMVGAWREGPGKGEDANVIYKVTERKNYSPIILDEIRRRERMEAECQAAIDAKENLRRKIHAKAHELLDPLKPDRPDIRQTWNVPGYGEPRVEVEGIYRFNRHLGKQVSEDRTVIFPLTASGEPNWQKVKERVAYIYAKEVKFADAAKAEKSGQEKAEALVRDLKAAYGDKLPVYASNGEARLSIRLEGLEHGIKVCGAIADLGLWKEAVANG